MAEERAVPGTAEWAELGVAYARNGHVLDAGCSSGYGAALLNLRGAAHVDAIDVDAVTIQQAGERFGRDGISFRVDNCETLAQTDGPFDLICSFEYIEYLEHPERFLAAAAQRLRSGATLLVSTPERSISPPYVQGRPVNPYHIREWYREDFRALLCGHFSSVEMRVQVQTMSQSRRVEGLAALRKGLTWSNPLMMGLWRKYPWFGNRHERAWKRLAGLATPSVEDYPIVEWELAPVFGTPCFHVAICRHQ